MNLRQQPLLERYRTQVDGDMRAFVRQYSSRLTEMLEYHLGWRDTQGQESTSNRTLGKSLRPTLCLLTADATRGKWQQAIAAAIALELLHNATLIHDDIQDADKERHHRPTVWALWGIGQAINAGDTALSLSSIAVRNLRDSGYSLKTILEVEDLIAKTCLRIMNGQERDLAFETRLDVTVDEYLGMSTDKTGILIETCILVGALLGHSDTATKIHLQRYGQALGRAFQISDDLLSIWGDIANTGKAVVGADIRRRKKSYPIVFALTNASGTDAEILSSIFHAGAQEEVTEADVSLVMDVLSRVGTYEETHRILLEQHAVAMNEIQEADLPAWAKRDYVFLADFFVQRQF